MYVVSRVCVHLREVNLVWLYIESRPAISSEVRADWQRNSSVSMFHSYGLNYMVKSGVCWSDIKCPVPLIPPRCHLFYFLPDSSVAKVMMFTVWNYFRVFA